MSGGSYDYLFTRDVDTIFSNQEDLERMADRLAELGHGDAAMETMDLLLSIRRFENRFNAISSRLGMVWKAVEWLDSGDSDKDSIDVAIEQYREGDIP